MEEIKMANGNSNALQQIFSGADVAIIFGEQYMGEAMSFTIGVNREAGPLYVMGRKEPIAIPKGKRGIGGSFILAQLGYDALLEYCSDIIGGAKDDKPIWVRKDEMINNTGPVSREFSSTQTAGQNAVDVGVAVNNLTGSIWERTTPNYVDQIPPFNATIIGMNEQGYKMGFRVYGISIINEGMALSIEELNMEKRYTFIAQAVSKMTKLAK